MEKDEFIKFLENKGINAKLEEGVVMVLYDGGTFPLARFTENSIWLKSSQRKTITEVRLVSGSRAEKSMSKQIQTKMDL